MHLRRATTEVATGKQNLMITAVTPAPQGGAPLAAVAGGPLAVLRLEGAIFLGAACVAFASLAGSWGWFAALFLVPDVAMLGYLCGARVGAIAYNVAHSCAQLPRPNACRVGRRLAPRQCLASWRLHLVRARWL